MLDVLSRRLHGGLAGRAAKDQRGARRLAGAIWEVEKIRAAAQGNVNPQLALAVLARRLRDLAA
jgi:hypothetical protein